MKDMHIFSLMASLSGDCNSSILLTNYLYGLNCTDAGLSKVVGCMFKCFANSKYTSDE